MHFGMSFANTGPAALPEYAAELARLAEDSGFESLWTVEHVVVPAAYESSYPYSRSGRMPGPENAPIPDPLIWLSYVAACTTTLKLGTGILILPQRQPVVLAKEAATLDLLSGGRLLLGVGVGWLREEFDALAVPFEERGRRADDYIAALRALWSADEVSEHEGEFVSFSGLKSFPKPAHSEGIPIVVGGHSKAAARRAGRLGDGFFPGRGKPDQLETLFDEMRTAALAASRDPDAIELTCGARTDPDSVSRLSELGVSRIVVAPLAYDTESLKRAMGEFSESVISKWG